MNISFESAWDMVGILELVSKFFIVMEVIESCLWFYLFDVILKYDVVYIDYFYYFVVMLCVEIIKVFFCLEI